MLILTRRVGEAVLIGSNIVVSVVGVKGNQVRLGIDAPSDVPVLREEVAGRTRFEDDNSGCPGQALSPPALGDSN